MASAPTALPKFQTLELLLQDRLLTVILNRPKRFNAFTGPMYEELVVALQWADSAATVSVCMLTANGTYYSSGNDLGNFIEASSSGKSADETSQESAVLCKKFVKAFIDFSKPLIAAVNGPCLGIACTTLGLCDIVYASPTAWFQTPFSQLGQSPEGCSSYTFPKLMGTGAANEVLMFGRKLTAVEACERRLVTAVFGPATSSDSNTLLFRQEATKRAAALAALPPKSLQASKQLTRDPERALLHQVNANECTLLIERWMSQDCQDAVMAFMAEQMAKQKQKKQAKSAAPATTTAAPASFQSAAVFEQLSKRIANEGASMVKKVDCVYRFDLTNAQSAQCSWLLNLKTVPGSVKQCTPSDAADCVVAMKDADFVQLMSGKLNAQQAFMRGQLKIKGNMMLAQKLSVLSAPSAKL